MRQDTGRVENVACEATSRFVRSHRDQKTTEGSILKKNDTLGATVPRSYKASQGLEEEEEIRC